MSTIYSPLKPQKALKPETGQEAEMSEWASGWEGNGEAGVWTGFKGLQFHFPGPKITEPETMLCIHETPCLNLKLQT